MITVILGAAGAALVLLFVGSLGQVSPGNPVVAVAIVVAVVVLS